MGEPEKEKLDQPERGNWSKPLEFVLSCLAYAVGLGNVWRFPYLCYRNGGGAFLVTYLIMLVLMGMPIFLMELLIGQYSGLGPDQAFTRLAPIFSGLGYCTLVVIALVTVYYMVIIAWTLFYLFASFTSELGYGSCQNDFNTMGCYSQAEDAKCAADATFYNKTCTSISAFCQHFNLTHIATTNKTHCFNSSSNEYIPIGKVGNRILATLEYFHEYVLGKQDATWENFGEFRWQLALCLLLAWIIGYLCVVRGVKTSGKAVYFTASFPYVVLTALVIQGATLDGAVDGILMYITPQWDKLLEAEVWGNAASQVFYSFGIGCGSLITLSSYSHFKNNCVKDVLIVSATNTFTSVYAGFAIFSMLGFLAKQQGVPVSEVATEGPGLAFVAYPEAILLLPLPQLWSVLFFIMLLTLGMGSQFAGVEAIDTMILDKWPHLRSKQWLITLIICVSCLVLGLPMCFGGGVYLFTLLEWNTASWAILLIGLAEIVSVSWAYGCHKFMDHMNDMGIYLSKFSYWYWWICFTIVTPVTLVGIFVFQMAQYEVASYADYKFPSWADGIGFLIGITTLVPMPVFAVYTLYTGKIKFKDWFKHSKDWGPQTSKSESTQTLTNADDLQSISTISTLPLKE